MPHPELTDAPPHARHARLSWPQRAARWCAVAAAGVLVVGGAAAFTAALGGPVLDGGSALDAAANATSHPPLPDAPVATALPMPSQSALAAASCDDPAVIAALASGSDADVIAAFGGAPAFRAVVAAGAASCVDLAEGPRTWVVVNKQRPLSPVEYSPEPQVRSEGVRQIAGGLLRDDAAAALSQLSAASLSEGAGEVAINSAYRSFGSQQRIHNQYVRSLGQDAADLTSARPGYSEHQTGLAVDVVACGDGCGSQNGFGGTPQADWVAANAWRFGFIVRYEQDRTDVTGYEWEPWHLRYIGVELASAYHDGGFHTLEEFFGLPAAPNYLS